MNPLNAIANDNETAQRMFREIAKYILDDWRNEILRIGKQFKIDFGLSIEALEAQLRQLEGNDLKSENILRVVMNSDCYKLVLEKSEEHRINSGQMFGTRGVYKTNMAARTMPRISRSLAEKMEKLSP